MKIRAVRSTFLILFAAFITASASSLAITPSLSFLKTARDAIIHQNGLLDVKFNSCRHMNQGRVVCNVSYKQELCYQIMSTDGPTPLCRTYCCHETFDYDDTSKLSQSLSSRGCQ